MSGVELKDKFRNTKNSDTNAISATNVRQIPKAAEYGNGAPKIFEDKKLSAPMVFLLQNFAL